MSESNVVAVRPARAVIPTENLVPVLDTAAFEQMQRVGAVMARSSLVPNSLIARQEGRGQDAKWEALPFETAMANCFLVVNQAVRWGMDPFAVAQCASVVHGRLMWEGKLVAAVIEQKLGIRLQYDITGTGENMTVAVSGKYPDEDRPRVVTGSVADWKTTGTGTPWTPKNYVRMLHYRGAREWARLYAPAVMLGVYTDDEFDQLAQNAAPQHRRVAPPPAPAAAIEAKANPEPAKPAEEAKPAEPAAPRRAPPPPGTSKRSTEPYGGPAPAPAKADPVAEDASFVDLIMDGATAPPAPAKEGTRGPDEIVEEYAAELADAKTGDEYDRINEAYLDLIQKLPPEHKAEALRARSEHGERFA